MKKEFIAAVILTSCSLLSAPTQANEQPPVPPQNNLGKEVNDNSLKVVYPRPEEVVEDTLKEIEDLQLTPEQYKRLKDIYIERERQKAIPYAQPPKPVTRTMQVNLDPGVSPPVLRLTRGQQTSIVFSDYSGNPWYIKTVSVNRQSFSDGGMAQNQGKQAEPTNVLTLEALKPAAYGNVTVTLKGLSTPLIFILTSAQKEVDMRVDAKIPGRNPDAAGVTSLVSMPSIDDSLTYFLDGVPPNGAQRLKVTGLAGTEAWYYKNNLYVRANGDAQYPAYVSAARSTSGVAVYRYANLHNSVTLTTGGQAITVFIEKGAAK